MADFTAAFSSKGFSIDGDDALQRLHTFALSLLVSPEWCAEHYELFMAPREYESLVTRELLEEFEEMARQDRKREQGRSAGKENLSFAADKWDNGGPVLSDNTNLQKTPARTPAVKSTVTGSKGIEEKPSSEFAKRGQKGQLLCALNDELIIPNREQAMEVDSSERCVIKLLPSRERLTDTFMMDKLADKVEYMEGRLLDFNAALTAAEGCSVDHPVHVAMQEEGMVVGRVCCDSEGRINESSSLLEGCQRHSQGQRTRLDLAKVPEYSVFPGQVLGVRGNNPSGNQFLASQLLAAAPAPMSSSASAELAKFAEATGESGVLVAIAAGPFTTCKDMSYQPLAELLAQCRQHRPDVLLLLGPFVDVEHPLVQEGLLAAGFDDIFQQQVLEPLEEFTRQAESTQVLLVPSTSDAHHAPVFPQGPLLLPPGSRVQALPNPATFKCNEFVIGTVTSDILKHVSGQQAQRGAAAADRMAAVASHLLAQRSYYPLFPAAQGALLDCSRGGALCMPCSPDILLLPSDLLAFAKLLPLPGSTAADPHSQVVCVNPGRLTRGTGGGSFALVQVGPSKEGLAVLQGQPAESNAACPNALHSRCRVEVRRI